MIKFNRIAILAVFVLPFLACAWLGQVVQQLPLPPGLATPTVTSAPTATATSTIAPTPRPTSVVESYIPQPPPLIMTTSGEPVVGGFVEITDHYKVVVSPWVVDEIPTREQDSGFWNPPGAKNCDAGHWTKPDGSHSIMWWVCGGSVKYHTEPREWGPVGPFEITCSLGLDCTYGRAVGDGSIKPGCYRDDWYNACVAGHGGTVTICVPYGAKTEDGIPVNLYERCGVWPVS